MYLNVDQYRIYLLPHKPDQIYRMPIAAREQTQRYRGYLKVLFVRIAESNYLHHKLKSLKKLLKYLILDKTRLCNQMLHSLKAKKNMQEKQC